MSLFKRKHKEFAGLFLDRGLFRFISLQSTQGNIEVVQTAFGSLSENLEEGEPFANSGTRLGAVLSEVISETGAIKVPVNIAIPTTDSLIRIVPLPNMELDEAKMAFRYDFERYFPFSVDEAIFDMAPITYPMPGNVEEERYLVAATRKILIENIMNAAEEEDIDVGCIEPSQMALERAITPPIAPADAVVYVYAGNRNSVMTLSWKGNGIFYRALSQGFGRKPEPFDPENAPDDAPEYSFVKQVRSSLQFAVSQIRGFAPDAVYLHGPAASDGLCELLKEALDIQNVVSTAPLRIHGIELNPADAEAGLWDIPIGLALRFL